MRNRRDEIAARDLTEQYWTEGASPALEARLASVYALSNGRLGLRGTHEELPPWASPGFYLAGTYCAAPRELVPIHPPDHILAHPERVKPEHHAEYKDLSTLPNLPNPAAVRLTIGGQPVVLESAAMPACERILHLREARLTRRLVVCDAAGHRTIVDSERFVSWARPHVVGLRYEVTPDGHDLPVEVRAFLHTGVSNARGYRLFELEATTETDGFNEVRLRTTRPEQRIGIAQASRVRREGRRVILEIAAAAAVLAEADPAALAREALALGYDALRAEHLAAVRRALACGHAALDADPLTRQGLEFGRLHLEMALCRDEPRVSVPIKGLTGEGYRFMVFWDTDFHMFPYYLFTNPGQARNLLLYRHRLLDAARRNAAHWGYRGAQIPWETGTTGEEETAPWLNLLERELHISSDTAYAVMLYDRAAGDPDFLRDYGAELVFETARFFASRVTRNEAARRYELREIGCPDQYHTFAHNNVFISRMAKWHLGYAAELAAEPRLVAVRQRLGLTDEEAASLRAIHDQLYIIPPDAEGIIEEFEGFFDRTTDLRGISERFCEHTQAVKQPDLLALYHLFGGDYSRDVLQANWRYYAARTLHGSSLSLPGMALAAAVAGLPDEAVPYFQRSARMDLDDVNLNTALGVHVSGYAVLWEALVFGFAGFRAERDHIAFDPCLPRLWGGAAFALQWRGARLEADLTHARLRLRCDAPSPRPVPVAFPGRPRQLLQPGKELVFELR
jgi:kojibiose phosphorylase